MATGIAKASPVVFIRAMAKANVTSADVARLAKVSQSAVSRTFTKGASVSADTRNRVLAAARELGYRPKALARSLISGRSGIIGVVVAYLHNQFYPKVIEQLSRALQDRGYHTLLFMTDPGDQDGVVQEILQYQVEAVVMASAHLSSSLAQECADNGIPIVMFNRYVSSSPASSVTSDNVEGGYLVGRYLAETGHKRIAFIAGFEDASTSRDREAGFYKGLAENGLACFARKVGAYRADLAAEVTRELFAQEQKPDAIFVANDHMAFAVMDVIRGELGLRVPEDVSVVGYDDVPQASWQAYDLTTVEQPTQPMVDATLSILEEQLENREITPRAAVLPARLILRGSSAKR